MSTPSEAVSPFPRVQYNIWRGPNGIRAGWRLLIFLAMVVPAGYGANSVVGSLLQRQNADPDGPKAITIATGIFLVALLMVSWIMAKIEGRSLSDYGLPWRRAFRGQFWQGTAISLASQPLFLGVLWLLGVFSLGAATLHGIDILKYGVFWALASFVGTSLEDFTYRGYILFTLSTGIGFWPAAIATSVLMGGMHYFNPGGHGLGPLVTLVYCLLTCLVLRRTGDLWMPVGIHSAWDWGAAFFFGVPSGGFVGHPHFLNASLHGPTLLTGGTFGPEGSLPNLVLLTVWGIGFSLWLRGVRYPNPAAVPDPRLRHTPLQD